MEKHSGKEYKLSRGTLEAWAVAVAVGADTEKIDKMKLNKDGTYDIEFRVGGVDLDFSKVLKRLDECYIDNVKKEAEKIAESMCEETIEIQRYRRI